MEKVLEASIAHYAQEALDLLNMEGPFGPMVPEDRQIKMTYEQRVEFGKFMLEREGNSGRKN